MLAVGNRDVFQQPHYRENVAVQAVRGATRVYDFQRQGNGYHRAF